MPQDPFPCPRLVGMAGRSYKTEAVVLRSIRFGEADRVLHLYTPTAAGIGAVAKGIRKTKSRFGGAARAALPRRPDAPPGLRRAPDHDGRRARPVAPASRDDCYRLSVGLIGAEAMLRLFSEQEGNERAFTALTRFLDCSTRRRTPPSGRARPARARVPAQAALALRLPAAPDELRRMRWTPRRSRATRRAPAAWSARLRAGRGAALSAGGLFGIEALLRARSLTPRPSGSGAGGARRAPRRDRARTSSTAASACARSPREARSRRRLRARRRPDADRPRRRHAFLAASRTGPRGGRATAGRAERRERRVVGLYLGEAQVGFARAPTGRRGLRLPDDVYVLEEYRGRGLGSELVRETVDSGPYAGACGCSTPRHPPLYAKLGFGPDARLMERAPSEPQ